MWDIRFFVPEVLLLGRLVHRKRSRGKPARYRNPGLLRVTWTFQQCSVIVVRGAAFTLFGGNDRACPLL